MKRLPSEEKDLVKKDRGTQPKFTEIRRIVLCGIDIREPGKSQDSKQPHPELTPLS